MASHGLAPAVARGVAAGAAHAVALVGTAQATIVAGFAHAVAVAGDCGGMG